MRLFAIFLFSLAFLAACNQPATVTFSMDYVSEVVVPSSTGVTLPFDMWTPEQETDSKAQFEVNDTRKDLVEQITLETCQLSIKYPSDQNFDFLNSIDLYLTAEGLDEILIASKKNIPENGSKTITLDPTGKDFKEYIKKDNFTLRVNTKTDKTVTREVGIEVYTDFSVKARLID